MVNIEYIKNSHYIDELNRVSAWLKNQMQKFGIPCNYQNYAVKAQNDRNVVCKLNAGASNFAIIGANYDLHTDTDGADDNALGVEGVLETAQILEEPPYFKMEQIGSAVYAKSVLSQKDKISGMFVLEMIGYFSPKHIQEYPVGLIWFYPAHGNFIEAVSNLKSR